MASEAEIEMPIDNAEVEENSESSENEEGGEKQENATAGTSNAADLRVKHKAKRPSKQLLKQIKETSNGSPGAAANHVVRATKNMRRPRNGFGRGLPKKGGAGGKGVWGKPGSELDAPQVMDENDPNYDSDSAEAKDITLETIVPVLSEEEMYKHVEPIVLEYFEHGDTHEAALALEDYNFGGKRYMIAVIAIELAMDHKPSHREMTSVLLSDLYHRVLTEPDIEKALDQLLKNLPDLVLDTPEAPTILGNFIARAVADDCLAPRFLIGYQGKVECELANESVEYVDNMQKCPLTQALARADVLLSMKHGMARLDNVWGVGGGLRPVTSLIRSMGLLLREYLSSDDAQEAARCLNELEVPHFHHELVYEAIVLALESNNEETENSIVKLLKFLADSVILTPEQMTNGFLRVMDELDDICLDVPNAFQLLERTGVKCRATSLITDELLQKLTARGRKRFVSEGDGGKTKN